MKLNLFHKTRVHRIDSIKKLGILHRPPVREWAGSELPISGRVYLTSMPDLIYTGQAIFLITKNININNLVCDEDAIFIPGPTSFNALSTTDLSFHPRKPGERPRSYLIRITKEMGMCGAIASLLSTGTVAHIGNISPKHLSETIYTTSCCPERDNPGSKNICSILLNRRTFSYAPTLIYDKFKRSRQGLLLMHGLRVDSKNLIEFPKDLVKHIEDLILHPEKSIITELCELEKERTKHNVNYQQVSLTPQLGTGIATVN